MGRHRCWITLGLVPLLTYAPSRATAGPLGKVVNGMRQRSGQAPRPPSGDIGDSHSRPSGGSSSPSDDSSCGTCTASALDGPTFYYANPPVWSQSEPDRDHLDAYVGVQSVDDSNYSASVSVMASSSDVGLGFANTAYYEDQGPNREKLSMHLFDLSLWYRAVGSARGGDSHLWLGGGLAGVHSDDLELYGATVGARATHALSPSLALLGAVRAVRLQSGIHGTEARAGVELSYWTISYRLAKFNTGPPLKGPEVGLTLRY